MRVIAGSARSLKLKTPAGMSVRPTTDRIKETLFNILSPNVYGSTFLDMFCGSGAIGIEALSRGAEKAVFIDDSKVSIQYTNDNLRFTKLDTKAEVLRCDARFSADTLKSRGLVFDIIFLDPPYDKEYEKTVLEQASFCDILKDDGIVIVESGVSTEFNYVSKCGLEIYREKIYGSNKHVFLRKA